MRGSRSILILAAGAGFHQGSQLEEFPEKVDVEWNCHLERKLTSAHPQKITEDKQMHWSVGCD
jgi:hypothetical protein